MAGTLIAAQVDYIWDSGTPPSIESVPLSMACWFQSSSITARQWLMGVYDFGANDEHFGLRVAGDVGGDPIEANTKAVAGDAIATTSTGYSANTWHHAAGVWAAADDRAAFIDGGSKGSEATSRTPVTLNTGSLGTWHKAGGNGGDEHSLGGLLAEVAFWSVALTDAEIATLAEGYSPFLVRPQSLVTYLPLVRNLTQNLGQDTAAWTNVGVTVGDHTRVLYPSSPSLVTAPAAVVAAIASQRLKIGHGR